MSCAKCCGSAHPGYVQYMYRTPAVHMTSILLRSASDTATVGLCSCIAGARAVIHASASACSWMVVLHRLKLTAIHSVCHTGWTLAHTWRGPRHQGHCLLWGSYFLPPGSLPTVRQLLSAGRLCRSHCSQCILGWR